MKNIILYFKSKVHLNEKHTILYYLDFNTWSFQLLELFLFLAFLKFLKWKRNITCQALFS